MPKWEYCILSGLETSLKRKMSVTLTFSDTKLNDQNFEFQLDGERSEEMLTTQYLGRLGSEGWEVVAFHRSVPKFEAVLKRPADFNEVLSEV